MKSLSNSFLKAIIFISTLSMCAVAHGNVEKELQYSSKLTQGNKISFSGVNANINIVKEDSDIVVYDVKMIYKKDNKKKAEETFNKIEWTFSEENKIHLQEKIKKHKKIKHLDIYVTITLPNGYPLDVSTVNGDIKTNDDLQTDLAVKSINGDIRLKGSIGGSLKAHNVNGLIRVGNVDNECNVNAVNSNIKLGSIGGKLEVRNINGQTSVKEVGSSITGNSVNGDISLTLAKETTGSVKIESVNGDLDVNCPKPLGVTVIAQSGNGSLSCNKKLRITKIKKNKIEGTSGDGSVNVKLKSVNGNVTIETY